MNFFIFTLQKLTNCFSNDQELTIRPKNNKEYKLIYNESTHTFEFSSNSDKSESKASFLSNKDGRVSMLVNNRHMCLDPKRNLVKCRETADNVWEYLNTEKNTYLIRFIGKDVQKNEEPLCLVFDKDNRNLKSNFCDKNNANQQFNIDQIEITKLTGAKSSTRNEDLESTFSAITHKNNSVTAKAFNEDLESSSSAITHKDNSVTAKAFNEDLESSSSAINKIARPSAAKALNEDLEISSSEIEPAKSKFNRKPKSNTPHMSFFQSIFLKAKHFLTSNLFFAHKRSFLNRSDLVSHLSKKHLKNPKQKDLTLEKPKKSSELTTKKNTLKNFHKRKFNNPLTTNSLLDKPQESEHKFDSKTFTPIKATTIFNKSKNKDNIEEPRKPKRKPNKRLKVDLINMNDMMRTILRQGPYGFNNVVEPFLGECLTTTAAKCGPENECSSESSDSDSSSLNCDDIAPKDGENLNDEDLNQENDNLTEDIKPKKSILPNIQIILFYKQTQEDLNEIKTQIKKKDMEEAFRRGMEEIIDEKIRKYAEPRNDDEALQQKLSKYWDRLMKKSTDELKRYLTEKELELASNLGSYETYRYENSDNNTSSRDFQTLKDIPHVIYDSKDLPENKNKEPNEADVLKGFEIEKASNDSLSIDDYLDGDVNAQKLKEALTPEAYIYLSRLGQKSSK